MAGEEIGNYAVGISLNLEDLVARVGSVEALLKRIETSVDSVDKKGKAAGSAWFLNVAGGLFVAEQAIKGVIGALNLIPAALSKSLKLFDDTVGAAGRYAKTLEIQATMVGTSVRQTADLQDGLEAVTGSADAATSVLLRLSRAVGAASGGQLRIPPKQAFAELGVALTDAAGRGKPFGDLMDELEAKFNKMAEGPRRTALALAIFGFQGGKLLEMFKELGSSGKTYQQSVDALGVSINTNLLDAAAKLDTQLNILKMQGETTWRLFGAEAAASFTPLIQELIALRKQIIDWVKDNKEGIADLASSIADKLREVVALLRAMGEAFAASGFDVRDVFIDAINLAERALHAFTVELATDIQDIAGLYGALAAAGAGLLSGPEAMANAYTAASGSLMAVRNGLMGVAAAGEAARLGTAQQTEAFRGQRDQLHDLYVLYQRVNTEAQPESFKLLRVTHLMDQMRDIIVKMGPDYDRLNESARRYYESAGLHAPTVKPEAPEAPDTRGPPTPKYDQRAIEQATKSIEKATEAANKERAAIIGGAQAKIAATVASKEFKAASDDEHTALERALTLLDESTQLQTRLKTLADTAKSVAQAGYANQLKLEKEALQIQLDRAKAEGNVQEEARLTTAVKQAELDETLAKERATYTQLMELRQALSNTDSAVQQIALRQLEAVGLAREADGAAELSEAQTRLDQLLGLYSDYVHQREALDKQAAAAAGAAIADQKKDIIDLRDTFLSVVDDMNAGIILGTKKMSDVWKSAWQSLEKQAEKAILNTALDLSGMNTKFSLTDLVKGLAGGAGGGGAAAGGEAAGGAGGLLGTIGGWFSRAPNPNVPGVSPAIAGPPAPGTAGTAAAGVGLFGGISSALSGLFGGGAKAGAGMPETVGAMTVNAGTVTILGAVAGAPTTGAAPGAAPPAPGAEGGAAPPEVAGGGPPAPAAGGGGQKQAGPDVGSAISDMGSSVVGAIKGVGTIFLGVGQLLMSPLKLLPNLLMKGFTDTGKEFAKGTAEGAQKVAKGTQATVKSVADLGTAVGSTLTTIGSMIGGKAGQIISLIGEVIMALFALIVAGTKVLGTGQTGGYFEHGALTRPPGTTAGTSRSHTIPILAHPGEGLINPAATSLLGGKDAIMRLNAGLIPPRLADLMASGLRVQMPALPGAFGGAGGLTQLMSSDDHSVTIHPGAIVFNVPEGMNSGDIGNAVVGRIVSHFGR